LTDECHQTPDKEENPSSTPKKAEEEQEFFDLIGKEHVDRRAKTAEEVRSHAQGELRFTLRCGL